MNRHTSELYRLAELPAFIEEALSNVSLKGIIATYLDNSKPADSVFYVVEQAIFQYAEQWVDEWIGNLTGPLTDGKGPDHLDPEIQAIEAGVNLFSNPDCKAGLPE